MAGDSAFGTVLKRGDGASPEVFTAIARCRNISGPSITKKVVDVSDHDDDWDDFAVATLNGGEVTLDLNWDYAQATHATLKTDLYASTSRNYKIEAPNGDVITFAAFCVGLSPAYPYEDRISAQATYKVTGEPTFA